MANGQTRIEVQHPGANSYNKETIEAEVVEPGSHTDASVLPSSNHSGGAGLLRDSNGSWTKGFSRLSGSSSCLLAELWASRYGIAMAKTLNIGKLIINVDAFEVINLFL